MWLLGDLFAAHSQHLEKLLHAGIVAQMFFFSGFQTRAK